MSKKKPKASNRRFILWSPSGPTNPRVTFDSQSMAEDAARSMANRHKADFFVCELVKLACCRVSVTADFANEYPPSVSDGPDNIPF